MQSEMLRDMNTRPGAAPYGTKSPRMGAGRSELQDGLPTPSYVTQGKPSLPGSQLHQLQSKRLGLNGISQTLAIHMPRSSYMLHPHMF